MAPFLVPLGMIVVLGGLIAWCGEFWPFGKPALIRLRTYQVNGDE